MRRLQIRKSKGQRGFLIWNELKSTTLRHLLRNSILIVNKAFVVFSAAI